MKKFFVLFLSIFAIAYFSMPAFAGSAVNKEGTIALDSGGNADVGLSSNVIASYYSDGSTYAAATYNPKGTGKDYGTGSETTYIWYKESGVSPGGTATIQLNESYDFEANGWESQ